jgi:hypothetical protein
VSGITTITTITTITIILQARRFAELRAAAARRKQAEGA